MGAIEVKLKNFTVVDGKKMLFSPEKAVEIQNKLGSDVAMCLDDVPLAGAAADAARHLRYTRGSQGLSFAGSKRSPGGIPQ